MLAIAPLVWIWIGLQYADVGFLEYQENGETWLGVSTAFEYYMESDLMLLGVLGAVAFAVLAILAIISAVGLQRGRFWVRVFTPIWVGLVVLAAATWIIEGSLAAMDLDGEKYKSRLFPIAMTMLGTGIAVTLLAILAYIMLFLRGVRTWAPGRQTVLVYRQVGPGTAGPVAPQGYPMQQQYQAPPQGHPQQQPPQGYPSPQPPRQGYQQQQPPYGGY